MASPSENSAQSLDDIFSSPPPDPVAPPNAVKPSLDDIFAPPPEPDHTALKEKIRNLPPPPSPEGQTPVAGAPEPDKVYGPPSFGAAGIPGPMPKEMTPAYSSKDGVLDNMRHTIEYGLEISTSGMKIHGRPDMLMPSDAPVFYNILARMTSGGADLLLQGAGGVAGGAAGILPGAFAGGVVGGLAGGALGGAPGAAIGLIGGAAAGTVAGVYTGYQAGAWGLPAFLRRMMMDQYEKGEVKDFNDFWERTSAALIDARNETAIGMATGGVGKAVGTVIQPLARPILRTAGVIMSEVATMVTLGNHVRGEAFDPGDLAQTAVAIAGLHGITHLVASSDQTIDNVSAKLRKTYAEAGIKPEQVLEHAINDPVVRQQMLAEGDDIPKAYRDIPVVSENQADDARRAADLGEKLPVGEPNEPLDRSPTAPGEEPVKAPIVAGRMEPEVSPQLLEKNPNLAPAESGEKPDQIRIPLPDKSVIDIFRNERGSVLTGKKVPVTDIEKANAAIRDRIESRPDFASEPYSWHRFYEDMVDRMVPLERTVRQLVGNVKIPTHLNPYELARCVVDSIGKGRHFLRFGTFDFNDVSKATGESLENIIRPHAQAGEQEDLGNWLVAARAREQHAKGLETGMPIEEANKVYDAGFTKFALSGQRIVNWQNRVLTYLRDSGVISADQHKWAIDNNIAFVPFYRISEEGTAIGGGRRNDIDSVLKRFKGSENKIVDPFESMTRNMFEYIRMAEKNRAVKALVDLQEQNPDVRIFREIEPPQTEVKSEEIRRGLEKQGIETSDVHIEGIDIFRPRELKENQFVLKEDGRARYFETDDLALARAIKAMDGNVPIQNATFRIAVKVAKAPATLMRSSLALTPDFILRNFTRDQYTKQVFSRYGGVPILETLHAMGDIWNEGEHFQNWLKSGGSTSSFLTIDADYIQKELWDLNRKTGFVESGFNVIRHPLDAIRAMSEVVEGGTRLSEFKRATAESRGGATHENILEGGYAAREVTVDFQRMGGNPLLGIMNELTAFQNAQIQGLDRAVRAFNADKVGTTARAVSYITLPSAALWAYNQKYDKEWYDSLEDWRKDMCWNVRAFGIPIRWPKPQELGLLFGSLVERSMEAYFADNPRAFKNFGETMLQLFTPSMMPTITVGPVEHVFNKSTWTGRSLVNETNLKKLPQEQFTEYTTETGKAMGKILDKLPIIGSLGPKDTPLSSPAIVENYINVLTGNTGRYVMQFADQLLGRVGAHKEVNEAGVSHLERGLVRLPQHATMTWAQTPFARAFLTQHPNPGAQPIQDFYDMYSQHEKFANSYKDAVDRRDTTRIAELQSDPGFSWKIVKLSRIHDALNNFTELTRKIDQMPMNRDEKRRQIDQLISAKIETARYGVQMMDDMEKRGTTK